MLNEYLPNDMLMDELPKRDYVLSRVERDDSWLGGNLVIPFKAAGASSVSAGQLSASNDIAQDTYVRGGINVQPEIWGSMIFNQRDLMEHGSLSDENFLKLLPDTVDDFLTYIKGATSVNLLNGTQFDKLSAAGASSSGVVSVYHPERWAINQKVQIGNPTAFTGYVQSIDMNALTVTLVTTRGGTTALNMSGNSQAAATGCYNDGFALYGFSSIRNAFLSLANGGSATLYGVTKTTYPYLQAINVSGALVSATTIMEKLFDGLTTIRTYGKGNPTEIVMSYRNFGSCMKVLENSKGAYNVVPNSSKTSQYGWMEIEIGSVAKGAIKLVGVQEMDEDVIYFIDWRALKFYSNGFFRKRKSPDGLEYYEIRAQTGYQYIVDISLFGDLVVQRPSYCGVMYGISY